MQPPATGFRTLVLNASPRPAGNTTALADLLLAQLPGEREALSAYSLSVAPCTACGACAASGVCVLDDTDAMSLVREKIAWADCIVIASPLHFTSLTAPMVSIISRWQSRWNFRCPEDGHVDRLRVGAVVATGGSDYPKMFECARRVAFAGFTTLGVELCGILAVSGMDDENAPARFSDSFSEATRYEAEALAQTILSRLSARS